MYCSWRYYRRAIIDNARKSTWENALPFILMLPVVAFEQETQLFVDMEGRERNRLMENKEQEAKTARRMEAWRQQV